MKLKFFRDITEHDVRNLFAFTGGAASQGDAVAITVGVIPTQHPVTITKNLGSGISNRVYSPQWETLAKVGLAASGTKPYGILLYGVQETDAYGTQLRYDPVRKAELQVVVSGETVPLLRRGLVMASGFSGAAGIGSGVIVNNNGNGQWVIVGAGNAASFATCIGPVDADGYATFEVNCY